MAEIISFTKAKLEKQDDDEGVFTVREDDGEMKDIIDWGAEDWQNLFETVFFPVAKEYNVSIYEIIADFMHTILTLEDQNDK